MITELTPARRLEMYESMLNYINEMIANDGKYPFGFCYAISWVRECNEPDAYQKGVIKRYYPELYKRKPKRHKVDYTGYWWYCDEKGTARRILILEIIIAQMKAL